MLLDSNNNNNKIPPKNKIISAQDCLLPKQQRELQFRLLVVDELRQPFCQWSRSIGECHSNTLSMSQFQNKIQSSWNALLCEGDSSEKIPRVGVISVYN